MRIENMGACQYSGPAVELMGKGRISKWINRRSKAQRGLLRAAADISTGGISSMFRGPRRRQAAQVAAQGQGIGFRSFARPAQAQAAELMGGRLKKFIAKVKKSKPKSKAGRILAAVATGGASEAARAVKKKAGNKGIARAVAAVATGGVSEIFTKKKTKAGRALQAIATGGGSILTRKDKAGKIARALVTGGGSRLVESKRARRAAAAIATGGASMLFAKGKAGKVARKVAGYMFAPVTMSTVSLVKKVKAAKAAKAEQAAAIAATAQDTEAAAIEAAAIEAAAESTPAAKTKKALPWVIGGAALAAIPFFLGE